MIVPWKVVDIMQNLSIISYCALVYTYLFCTFSYDMFFVAKI